MSQLASNWDTDLTRITEVARGDIADQYLDIIRGYRRSGYLQTGTITATATKVDRIRKDRYRVLACVDVSRSDLVDENGNSVVAPNRNPRVIFEYVVERDGRDWFVISGESIETC